VSGEIWFLFLMVGLKLPVFGIGYFLYRVLRSQEDQWEHLGWDEGPTDDGGGGGGGGSPSPAPRPRGGPSRAREPRRRPLPSARGRMLAPARRPAPLRTRAPRPRVPHRS
jgi:hypothetical protein